MSKTQFKHRGATFTVHPLTVMQHDIARKLEWDLQEGWLLAHEHTKDDYPRMHDVLWLTFIAYMLATDIEGEVTFTTVNPALANGNLVSAYDSWATVLLADRDLQNKWETAYRVANENKNDPEAVSDVPSGESK